MNVKQIGWDHSPFVSLNLNPRWEFILSGCLKHYAWVSSVWERESSAALQSITPKESTSGGCSNDSPLIGAGFRRLMTLMASSSGIQSHSCLDRAEISILRLISFSSLLFDSCLVHSMLEFRVWFCCFAVIEFVLIFFSFKLIH